MNAAKEGDSGHHIQITRGGCAKCINISGAGGRGGGIDDSYADIAWRISFVDTAPLKQTPPGNNGE